MKKLCIPNTKQSGTVCFIFLKIYIIVLFCRQNDISFFHGGMLVTDFIPQTGDPKDHSNIIVLFCRQNDIYFFFMAVCWRQILYPRPVIQRITVNYFISCTGATEVRAPTKKNPREKEQK